MPEALYQPFPLPTKARAHVWHHIPETRRPRHFHIEPEFNLVTRGSGVFGVGDRTIAVVAGDLLWWAPGQDHVLLEASVDFDLFVIGLTPELSERALGNRTTAAVGATRVHVAVDIFGRFLDLCSAPLPRDPSSVETLVGDFWVQAHGLGAMTSGRHTFTNRALASLSEHPELKRSDVASAVRGHPSEVSRQFHKDIGLTLSAYRTRLRLLRFIELARDGEANLLGAALAAGFGSYSQCHRTFIETLGCNPRRYFRSELSAQMERAVLPVLPGSSLA